MQGQWAWLEVGRAVTNNPSVSGIPALPCHRQTALSSGVGVLPIQVLDHLDDNLPGDISAGVIEALVLSIGVVGRGCVDCYTNKNMSASISK